MGTLIEIFWREVQSAFRRLVRSPGYLAVGSLTLALGVGGATAVASLAKTVLQPLDFPDAHELVSLREDHLGKLRANAPANYLDWRRSANGFDALAAVGSGIAIAEIDGALTRKSVAWVSGNFFDVLSVRPSTGRTFSSALDTNFEAREIVLSYRAANSGAIAETVNLDGITYDVVGTMPADFYYPSGEVFGWIRAPREVPPLPGVQGDWAPDFDRSSWYFDVVGRLAEGTSLATAQAELDVLSTGLAAEHPETNEGVRARLTSLQEEAVANFRGTLLGLALAVSMLLAAALINISHLARSRAEARRGDRAVRLALGASRLRLNGSQLAEGAILGAVGGMIGIGLSSLALRVAAERFSQVIPRAPELAFTSLDGAAMAVLLGITVGGMVGLLASLSAGTDTDLRRQMRPSVGGSLLISCQVAASIAVLTGTVLLVASFARLGRVEPGFTTDDLVTMWVSPTADQREERIQDLATIRDRLLEEPGVLSVGLAINAPSQTRINAGVWTNGVQPADNVILWSAWQPVDGDLIETLQVPLLQGRLLDPQLDRADTENVAVVNEAFVRDVLKGEPALEARVSVGPDGHDRPSRIVGIVADTRNRGPAVPPGAVMYRPLSQARAAQANSMFLAVRTAPGIGVAPIQAAVRAAAPNVVVHGAAMGEELIRPYRRQQVMLLSIIGTFGTIALFIALVGVAGVGLEAVRRRRAEIGVRMALGASNSRILWETMARGLRAALVGVLPGVILALVLGRSISGALFGVSETDLLPPIVASLAVVILTGAAMLGPAQIAASTSPAKVIKDG